MDDVQQRRLANNEARYREVNESLKSGMDDFAGEGGLPDGTYSFVCECALAECEEMLELTGKEYEHVRSEATWFAILPGHDVPETESVVEQHAGFHVVAKEPPGAEIARERDPRG